MFKKNIQLDTLAYHQLEYLILLSMGYGKQLQTFLGVRKKKNKN